MPTATAHNPGENEYSSTWVGIGGGCLDAGCTATDSTLIQAGTEQDVDAGGHAAYSAWWEIIPSPAMPVDLVVTAGDRVTVTIAESVPEVWGITIINQTAGQGWSTTTPYLSTYATAEWIVESPVVVGGGGGAGIASLPRLSTVGFDHATVNGGGPDLIASEAMELINANSQVLATPSGPDAELDGFNDCTVRRELRCSQHGSAGQNDRPVRCRRERIEQLGQAPLPVGQAPHQRVRSGSTAALDDGDRTLGRPCVHGDAGRGRLSAEPRPDRADRYLRTVIGITSGPCSTAGAEKAGLVSKLR